MKLTGAQITIGLLERFGIDTIAGIPGGSNLPLYDALYESSIRHILSRHEQGAGFIAQGIARSSGKTAVCFATSGPGGTKVITALADARLDSVPVLFITGQVALPLIGTDAFQEVDAIGMSLPITKHNFLVRSAAELLTVIPEAFRIAASGRPGPVLVDIPKDVQQQVHEFEVWPQNSLPETAPSVNDIEMNTLAKMIMESQRPVLYIGGGIIHSNASERLRALASKNSIPVASSLMGLGAMRHDDPLFLGMLGMHGAPYTNRIVDSCDLLLVFGARFGDRATGNVVRFCPEAKIAHIDIDRSEFGKIKQADFSTSGDIGEAIEALFSLIAENPRHEWRRTIESMREKHPFAQPPADDRFHPCNAIRAAAKSARHDAIVTTDVGQHQMWVAQYYPFTNPRSFLTSGGLGTMGFGLPAAIGAALAFPSRQVICFTGDGSLLMNIQEMATLAELGLDVKVLLLNNCQLGLVRQQQDLFYSGRLMASQFIRNPDFTAIARGFGMRAVDIAAEKDPLAAIGEIVAEKGPILVNIPVDPRLQVLPMVPPGASNSQMIGA